MWNMEQLIYCRQGGEILQVSEWNSANFEQELNLSFDTRCFDRCTIWRTGRMGSIRRHCASNYPDSNFKRMYQIISANLRHAFGAHARFRSVSLLCAGACRIPMHNPINFAYIRGAQKKKKSQKKKKKRSEKKFSHRLPPSRHEL